MRPVGDMQQLSVLEASALSPSYRKLRHDRAVIAWSLSLFVLVTYYAFVMIVAFRPAWLSVRFGASPMTIGFPVAVGMIVLFWLLTGFYARFANSRFDRLSARAVREISR